MKTIAISLLFTTLILLLLRTVLGQSNHKYNMQTTASANRFSEFDKLYARLPGGAPTALTPSSARSEGAGAPVDAGGESAPLSSANAGAAPKEHRSYPTLATSKLQPPERESSTDGRLAGGGSALEAVPPMSSYSQFKWNTFGRRAPMETYRNSRLNANYPRMPPPSYDDSNRALQHSLLMSRRAVCKMPRAKVINVKDLYPQPGKSYVPPCTVLHRCGDDTACCPADSDSCLPLRTQVVELYFYSAISTGRSNIVEKLKFVNHTECSCRDKYEDQMPRDMDTGPQTGPYIGLHMGSHQGSDTTHARHRHPPPAWTASRAPRWPQSAEETKSTTSRLEPCRCPREFHPRHSEGSCICECFDRQQECLHMKKGMRYFPYQDKICIEKRHCQPPSCEFGPYLRESGRCARKNEFSSWSHPSAHRESLH